MSRIEHYFIIFSGGVHYGIYQSVFGNVCQPQWGKFLLEYQGSPYLWFNFIDIRTSSNDDENPNLEALQETPHIQLPESEGQRERKQAWGGQVLQSEP